MTILLTGFEPYNDAVNASGILVESLRDRSPLDMPEFARHVRCRIMPVDTERIAESLDKALAEIEPDICIFTGQAPGRNRVTLERVAINLRDFDTPDTAGRLVDGLAVDPNGPVGYWSTLPDSRGLVERWNASGVPAAFSNHGGNHLCNQILYLGLRHAERTGRGMKAGFIHLPLLPQQIRGAFTKHPFMPLDMSRRAVEIAVAWVLKHAADAVRVGE